MKSPQLRDPPGTSEEPQLRDPLGTSKETELSLIFRLHSTADRLESGSINKANLKPVCPDILIKANISAAITAAMRWHHVQGSKAVHCP